MQFLTQTIQEEQKVKQDKTTVHFWAKLNDEENSKD